MPVNDLPRAQIPRKTSGLERRGDEDRAGGVCVISRVWVVMWDHQSSCAEDSGGWVCPFEPKLRNILGWGLAPSCEQIFVIRAALIVDRTSGRFGPMSL